jgi:hypothetical protein
MVNNPAVQCSTAQDAIQELMTRYPYLRFNLQEVDEQKVRTKKGCVEGWERGVLISENVCCRHEDEGHRDLQDAVTGQQQSIPHSALCIRVVRLVVYTQSSERVHCHAGGGHLLSHP